jgi:hypothetical protein
MFQYSIIKELDLPANHLSEFLAPTSHYTWTGSGFNIYIIEMVQFWL